MSKQRNNYSETGDGINERGNNSQENNSHNKGNTSNENEKT